MTDRELIARRLAGQHLTAPTDTLTAAGDLCAVLTPSGLRIYDETLAQCASAGTLRAASAAVLLADGSVILLDGGSGTRYLPE